MLGGRKPEHNFGANGTQRAFSASYQTVGHFDPATNETKDASYGIVARGNTLAALIWGA